MDVTARPLLEELQRAECEEVLARNHVGRIAYARGNRVDIEPVNYVYADGWIYGRTSAGEKVDTTGYDWWPVAFEVDEVANLFHWTSVVVHGGFYATPADGPGADAPEWRRALELLRTLIPETLTPRDPVPFRDVLFRIAVQEVSGRAALPGIGAPV